MRAIRLILPVLILLSMAFGTYFFIDNRYARSEDLERLERRLEYAITADALERTQQRIWTILDRYECITEDDCIRDMPQTVLEELRQLEEKKTRLEKRLDALEKVQ